ncbi:MAG: histidine kinase [Spirochaetaceae bacterium]|nr:histidine kinase [Spirochaetaceae bacterium]
MFAKLNLKEKLLVLFLIVGIIPILISNIISNRMYTENLRINTEILNNQRLDNYEKLLSERFDIYRNKMYELLVNKELMDLCKTMNDTSLTDSSLALVSLKIKNILSSLSIGDKYINSIVIITNNNRYITMSKKGDTLKSIWTDDNIRKDLFEKLPDKFNLNYYPLMDLYRGYTDSCISIGCRIGSLTSDKTYGGIIMSLDKSILLSSSSFFLSQSGVSTLILSENNQIVLSDKEEYINKNLSTYKSEVLKNVNYTMKLIPIKNSDWSILSIINNNEFYSEIRKSTYLVFIIILIIIVISLVALYLISSTYTASIIKISKEISLYSSSNRSVNFDIKEKDELYSIASQFKFMTEKNNDLLDLLEKKNSQIIKAINKQKKTEIKALEAQINPHFLYNTLDSINWMAIENDQIKISEMLSSLGEILRYSISNIDEVVLLSDEVKWLKKYFYLQNERFSNSFIYNIDIDKSCCSLLVYKMLFQPLIENAIFHGLEGVKKGGKILITINRESKEFFSIVIADNGKGIEKTQLKKIEELITNPETLDHTSIGISNVVNRINLYFKGEGEIKVKSSDEGTIFKLTLPIIECKKGE